MCSTISSLEHSKSRTDQVTSEKLDLGFTVENSLMAVQILLKTCEITLYNYRTYAPVVHFTPHVDEGLLYRRSSIHVYTPPSMEEHR